MKELLKCDLCPRMCAANRLSGAVGYCRAGVEVKAFRWGPHMGEEPPLSGENGSGTVFFSHCTLGCVYCQNYPWSARGEGQVVGTDGLVQIFREIAEAGCRNINLVTPGPWYPFIEEAAQQIRSEGIYLPFVCNTSGYERVEVAERYRDLMDIVLTDLRYSTAESAQRGSAAPNYVEHAREFIKWSAEHIGSLVVDTEGLAKRGLIVRVLVLPGLAQEAVENLEWLADTVGNEVAVSVMSQYTPVYKALEMDGWNRPLEEQEYNLVLEAVDRLGFENGWVQEFGSTTGDDGLLGRNMTPGLGIADAESTIQRMEQ